MIFWSAKTESFYIFSKAEVHLGPCQRSMMGLFTKILTALAL